MLSYLSVDLFFSNVLLIGNDALKVVVAGGIY